MTARSRNYGLLVSPTSPAEETYQWCDAPEVPNSNFQAMVDQGWQPVPAPRHPEMQSRDGMIVFQSMVLMMRSRTKTEKAVAEDAAFAAVALSEAEGVVTYPPHTWAKDDKVFNRTTGRLIGTVSFVSPANGLFEIRTAEGDTITGNASRRANGRAYPPIEDMVATEAEAFAYMDERARLSAKVLAATMAANTGGDPETIEHDLISFYETDYEPPSEPQS